MRTGEFTGFSVTLRNPGIAWIQFNTPERLNGLTHRIKRDLVETNDLSEDQVLTQRVYLQLHLSARLSLLERLRYGEISLLAYASAMSILNIQLAAGVFFQ